eukprot:TRINITY_DN29363_c0_g1_i1.p2 TRINITY_DN29363_c0_g1~~TRINITY_DN29363_c0_g1_i1.p2  ORF type:complete len:308 (+),score=60.14 TRINITY_DN29363_c0_g1_i1:69-992(+)
MASPRAAFALGVAVGGLLVVAVRELGRDDGALREVALRAELADLRRSLAAAQGARHEPPAGSPPEGRSCPPQAPPPVDSCSCPVCGTARGLRSMEEIGATLASDKVMVHRYHRAYVPHLEPRRGEALRVLEIGLGCEGLKDIGLGVRLWGEYLPRATLHVVEYNEPCLRGFVERNRAKRWGPRGGLHVHTGDQSNLTFLARLAAQSGPWDVVVDDGSHESDHQIASFTALWPHVAPGGLYAIEDLQTSFWAGRWGGNGTAVRWIADSLLPQVHTRQRRNGVWTLDSKFKSPVARVDCHHFICIVTKR